LTVRGLCWPMVVEDIALSVNPAICAIFVFMCVFGVIVSFFIFILFYFLRKSPVFYFYKFFSYLYFCFFHLFFFLFFWLIFFFIFYVFIKINCFFFFIVF
jgi:hypothetical protein